jgi:hypothetical protein
MFAVTEEQAAAIRTVFEQRGEFSAAVELRRMFPGIRDAAQARECVRIIAGWKALPGRRATSGEGCSSIRSGRRRVRPAP